jgi:hypothetical protein
VKNKCFVIKSHPIRTCITPGLKHPTFVRGIRLMGTLPLHENRKVLMSYRTDRLMHQGRTSRLYLLIATQTSRQVEQQVLAARDLRLSYVHPNSANRVGLTTNLRDQRSTLSGFVRALAPISPSSAIPRTERSNIHQPAVAKLMTEYDVTKNGDRILGFGKRRPRLAALFGFAGFTWQAKHALTDNVVVDLVAPASD